MYLPSCRSLIQSARRKHLARLVDRCSVAMTYNHQAIGKHPAVRCGSLLAKPAHPLRRACVYLCTSVVFQWAGCGGGAARLAGMFLTRSSKPATCPLTHFLKASECRAIQEVPGRSHHEQQTYKTISTRFTPVCRRAPVRKTCALHLRSMQPAVEPAQHIDHTWVLNM